MSNQNSVGIYPIHSFAAAPGVTLEQAIGSCHSMSQFTMGEPVFLNFNGAWLMVTPRVDPKDLAAQYRKAVNPTAPAAAPVLKEVKEKGK